MISLFQKVLQALKTKLWGRIDYDGAYGYQCVDYVRWYAKEIGHTIGTFSGSAYNGWTTMSPFRWTEWQRKIYKTWKIAPRWAIVFFAPTPKNKYGHVAVVMNATLKTITVSEQNAGSWNGNGIGSNAITVRSYPYSWAVVGNVLWWYELP